MEWINEVDEPNDNGVLRLCVRGHWQVVLQWLAEPLDFCVDHFAQYLKNKIAV